MAGASAMADASAMAGAIVGAVVGAMTGATTLFRSPCALLWQILVLWQVLLCHLSPCARLWTACRNNAPRACRIRVRVRVRVHMPVYPCMRAILHMHSCPGGPPRSAPVPAPPRCGETGGGAAGTAERGRAVCASAPPGEGGARCSDVVQCWSFAVQCGVVWCSAVQCSVKHTPPCHVCVCVCVRVCVCLFDSHRS
jgi:hypothetical protein